MNMIAEFMSLLTAFIVKSILPGIYFIFQKKNDPIKFGYQ